MTRTIAVKGTGNVSVPPDFVRLSLTLVTFDADYSRTMAKSAARLDELAQTVTALGFAAEDLKTGSYGVATRTRNRDSREQRTCYECTHVLYLSFDFDRERFSEVLTALGGCSAAPQINIDFTVKDPDAVKEDLLRAAAKNARRKAEILASESGVKLGQLISVNYDWTDIFFSSNCFCEGRDGCFSDSFAMAPERFTPEDISAGDDAVFVWEIE